MAKEFPIIDKLGGRENVQRALAERGVAKSKDAIRMWSARGTIPGKAVVVLHTIALERGLTVEPSDFLLAPTTSKAA